METNANIPARLSAHLGTQLAIAATSLGAPILTCLAPYGVVPVGAPVAAWIALALSVRAYARMHDDGRRTRDVVLTMVGGAFLANLALFVAALTTFFVTLTGLCDAREEAWW